MEIWGCNGRYGCGLFLRLNPVEAGPVRIDGWLQLVCDHPQVLMIPQITDLGRLGCGCGQPPQEQARDGEFHVEREDGFQGSLQVRQ